MTLGACQTSGDAPAEVRTDISSCLRIAQTVELPPITAGMDARTVIARYRVALIGANANITDIKACMAALDRAEKNGYFQ
jgi:hypothetical protein